MTEKTVNSLVIERSSQSPVLPLRRRLNRRRLLGLSGATLGTVLISPLIGACRGAGEEPTATTAPFGPATTPAPASPAAAETPAATEAARYGGELVIANEQNPVSLDPHFVRDVGSSRAMFYMYDPLIKVNQDLDLEPWLAEQWEVTEDGMEYTLYLRKDVTFHDDTPFNAEAVKFNLERQWDEQTNTRYIDDFKRYVESIDVVDEYAVRITLKELFVIFPRELLAFGSGHMISPSAVQELGQDFAQRPVGTGPFKFQEFVQDSHLLMVRNDNYWGGKPYLDSLRVRIIPEQNVQMVELEAGNVHVSFSVQAKDVKRLQDAGITVINQPVPTASWISFNLAKGPTRELAVRQAIALSVDREAIVREVLLGYGQVSRGGSPQGWPRYHEDIPIDPYDPEQAKRILDEAGWAVGPDGVRVRNGERLKVNILSTQLERGVSYGLMNQIIQQSVEKIGFETELRTLEWGAYLDEFRAGEWWHVTFHAQNANAKDLVGAAIDPDAYWNVNQLGKVKEGELVEVANRVREIYRQMNQELDPQKRVDLWKEIQLLIQEYQLISWLIHWDFLVGVRPEVKDLVVKPVYSDTLYNIHRTWLEQG
jgi:peptide/nickel transport system substrate-binding protein